ncbi:MULTISPECIES: hypothetical protein [Streptomyces]|uniref:hypothetical protein n=1 Tax=Streptomyces TaxID=1883 RepID=UPI0029A82695|nr:hypothetical protein [Streptomyces sp. ND04-05B]MDX3061931.1 hypothetical protein [Streptomyces sp. ND04-05B]
MRTAEVDADEAWPTMVSAEEAARFREEFGPVPTMTVDNTRYTIVQRVPAGIDALCESRVSAKVAHMGHLA